MFEERTSGIARPPRGFPISRSPTFARVSDEVTALFEDVGERCKLCRELAVVRTRFGQLPMVKSCQQCGSARRATWRISDTLIETNSVLADTIESGR